MLDALLDALLDGLLDALELDTFCVLVEAGVVLVLVVLRVERRIVTGVLVSIVFYECCSNVKQRKRDYGEVEGFALCKGGWT